VRVLACGVFLCVVVPGAFVRLDLDESAGAHKRVCAIPVCAMKHVRLCDVTHSHV